MSDGLAPHAAAAVLKADGDIRVPSPTDVETGCNEPLKARGGPSPAAAQRSVFVRRSAGSTDDERRSLQPQARRSHRRLWSLKSLYLKLFLSSHPSLLFLLGRLRAPVSLPQRVLGFVTGVVGCLLLLQFVLSSRSSQSARQGRFHGTDSASLARVLVVMADSRPLLAEPDSALAFAVYANFLYSRRHARYDFVYVQHSIGDGGDGGDGGAAAAAAAAASADSDDEPTSAMVTACCDSVLQQCRAAPWCKLQVLYRLMATDAQRHDWILFLDSDAAVFNWHMRVERWLSMVAVQGCSGRDFSLPQSACSFLFYANTANAHSFQLPNSGVWLVKLSALSLQLLALWWHQPMPDYSHQRPYEQAALWQMMDSLEPGQRQRYFGVILEPSVEEQSALQFVQHRSGSNSSARLPVFRALQQRIARDRSFAEAGIDTDFRSVIAFIREQAVTAMDLTQDEVPAAQPPPVAAAASGSGQGTAAAHRPMPKWMMRLQQLKLEQANATLRLQERGAEQSDGSSIA